jgi:hypothetical protein
MTATALRKSLFRVLMEVARSVPKRIRYRGGDAILLSYRQYLALRKRKKPSSRLQALMPGKILKPLNQEAEKELLDYMGIH